MNVDQAVEKATQRRFEEVYEGPEKRVPTDEELLRAIPALTWESDCGDYLIPDSEGENFALISHATVAAQATEDNDKWMYDAMCRKAGEIVIQNIITVARGAYEAGRLEVNSDD